MRWPGQVLDFENVGFRGDEELHDAQQFAALVVT
jgi:hypothetical protein